MPSLLVRWWGGGHRLTIERFDLRPGGAWRFVEHTPDGPQGFEGRFSRVEAPRALAMSFAWDGAPGQPMLDELTLEADPAGGTRLATVTTALQPEGLQQLLAAGAGAGMEARYVALDAVLASATSADDAPAAPATVRPAASVPVVEVKAGTGTAMHVLVGPQQGDTNFALRRFVMQPGGGMPLHTNLVEHQQYVLRGRARIRIGDAVHEVQADHTLFIPAGVPHSYEVLDGPFEFICVVPDRADQVTLVGAC